MAKGKVKVSITADADGVKRGTREAEADIHRLERSSGRSMAAMRGGALAAGAAITGIAVGVYKTTEAAIEAEKAQARLEAQMRALGFSYQAHAKEIDNVIQKTSRLAALDDEDLSDAFTNIVRSTGNVERSMRLVGLAADLARAKQLDVAKAGEIVGKVAAGNTGVLGRYGITIEKGATATQALAQLQQKFAGQARAYGSTTAGSIERAQVAFENLKEAIGARFAPAVAAVSNSMARMLNQMSAGQGAGKRFSDAMAAAAQWTRAAWKDVSKFFGDIIARTRGDFASFQRSAQSLVGPIRQALTGIVSDFKKAFGSGEGGGGIGESLKSIIAQLIHLQAAFTKYIVVPLVKRVLPAVRQGFGGLADVIAGSLKVIDGLLRLKFGEVWDGVRQIFRGGIKSAVAQVRAMSAPMREGASRAGSAVVDGLRSVSGGFVRAGRQVVAAIVQGIKSSPGAIMDAVRGLIPDSLRGAISKLGGRVADVLGLRGGGRVKRYGQGGLVDTMMSPGEALRYPDGGWGVVPGAPTAADSVFMPVPSGTEVYTWSGQAMLASGVSRSAALAAQAPHFAGGGRVRGRVSTFGPPLEQAGLTAYGLSSSAAGIAVNPGMGRTTWDNAEARSYARKAMLVTVRGRSAVLPVIDKGPSIPGRAIDITGAGVRRLGFSPASFPTDAVGTATLADGAAGAAGRSGSVSMRRLASRALDAASAKRYVNRFRLGVSGAFEAGVTAGYSGIRRLVDVPDAITNAQQAAMSRIAATTIRFDGQSRSSGSGRGSAGSGGGWLRPLSGAVTSGFGPRSSPGGVGSTSHQGIDLAAAVGTPVRAAKAGRVASAGYVGGYGNYMVMDHGGGWGSAYGHLSRFSRSTGSRVSRGATIARSGATGNVTGPHLHFEILRGGQRVNPASVMRFGAGGTVRARRALGKLVNVDPLDNQGMGDAMRTFGAVLSMITGRALAAMADRIDKMISGLAKGGFTRQERVQADRLRQAGLLVGTERGRRLGQARGRNDVQYAMGLLSRPLPANQIEEAQQAIEDADRQQVIARRELKDAMRSKDLTRIAAAYAGLGDANRGAQSARQAKAAAEAAREDARYQSAVSMAGLTAGKGDDLAATIAQRDRTRGKLDDAARRQDYDAMVQLAGELQSLDQSVADLTQAVRYDAANATAKSLSAELVKAQVLTPDNQTDDMAVMQQQLANATDAFHSAVAANDADAIIQWGGEIVSLRGSLESLSAAVTSNTQALLDLQTQIAQDAQRNAAVAGAQTDALKSWLLDFVSGGLGQRVGYGMGTPSYAGGLTRI